MAYFRLETDYKRFLCSFKDCLNLLKGKLHIFALRIWYDFDNQDYWCTGEYLGSSEVPNHFFSSAEVIGKCVNEGDITTVYLDLSDCPFSFEEVPLFFFPPVDNPELASDIQELLSQNIIGYRKWEFGDFGAGEGIKKSIISLEDGLNIVDNCVNASWCEVDEGVILDTFDIYVEHKSDIFCLCDGKTNKVLLSFTFSSPYVFHVHTVVETTGVPPALITETREVAREVLCYLEDGSMQRKYQYLTKTETGEIWWM